MRKIYLVGSLENPRIQDVANQLRTAGHTVFDDWQAAGTDADKAWTAYEKQRGRNFVEALNSPAARNVFLFDLRWLEWCDTGILVLPAGKSAHLELGRLEGRGKDVHILLDGEPEGKFDVMYALARVHYTVESIMEALSDSEGKQLQFEETGPAHGVDGGLSRPVVPQPERWYPWPYRNPDDFILTGRELRDDIRAQAGGKSRDDSHDYHYRHSGD